MKPKTISPHKTRLDYLCINYSYIIGKLIALSDGTFAGSHLCVLRTVTLAGFGPRGLVRRVSLHAGLKIRNRDAVEVGNNANVSTLFEVYYTSEKTESCRNIKENCLKMTAGYEIS